MVAAQLGSRFCFSGGNVLLEGKNAEARTLELRDLLNFIVADARRADPQPFARAVHQRANRLEVDVPATLGDVVSVADAVPEGRAATT